AEGDRERPCAGGEFPFPHHRHRGRVPRPRRAVPAAPAGPRRGGRDPRPRVGSGLMREGRRPDELRAIDVVPDFVEQADGSVLISFGKTRVLCTASIEEGVPRWLVGGGGGGVGGGEGRLPGP